MKELMELKEHLALLEAEIKVISEKLLIIERELKKFNEQTLEIKAIKLFLKRNFSDFAKEYPEILKKLSHKE